MTAHIPAKRREADKLLLLLLQENGCFVPKGVSSVGQLSSDAIIEAVGSLVPGIDGSSPLPEARSTRGRHPADRHRVCLAVASRIREVGYSDPLSAHQLLYPAEGSTRQLLLALLSMLPPDGAPPPLPPLPPPALFASDQIPPPASAPPALVAEEREGSDLQSSELSEKERDTVRVGDIGAVSSSQDLEALQSGGPGSIQKEGTEARTIRTDNDDPKFFEKQDASSEQEPGESQDTEGVEEDGIHPGKGCIADEGVEEVRCNEEGEAEKAAGEGHVIEVLPQYDQRGGEGRKEGKDASSEAQDEDEAAEFRVRAKVVDPLSEKPGSSDTSIGAASTAQLHELENGRMVVPDGDVSVEELGRVGITDENGDVDYADRASNNGRLEQQQEDDDEEEEENVFGGGPVRLKAVVDEETETIKRSETAILAATAEGHDAMEGVEDFNSGLEKKQAVDVAGYPEEQAVGSTPEVKGAGAVGSERMIDLQESPVDEGGPKGEDEGDGKGDSGVPPPIFREQHSGKISTVLDSAEAAPDVETAKLATGEIPEESCDPAIFKNEGEAAAEVQRKKESLAPKDCDLNGEETTSPVEEEKEEREVPAELEVEATTPFEDGVGLGEGVVDGIKETAGDDNNEDDVAFLQFLVDAQEAELNRLLEEEEIASKTVNQLQEEVRSLASLAEEREDHCRFAAKALELLPNATEETVRLQREITAVESQMRAAQKSFAKTRKPLEEVVRVQREELARRKARCRDLLSEIRNKYDESEEMTRQESLLRAAARDMERWERQKWGDITTGSEEGGEDLWGGWGEDVVEEKEGAEETRRKQAGALMRAEIDKYIASLCDEALAQKQEISISLSEVLDSRREANSAWDLLGRSEALAEEKLFSASKDAIYNHKDRARDLIEAYKCLHAMDGVFSSLMETVSGLTKREEECQLVEDETARIVSQHGGSSLVQILLRDLKRVREDAFALEQRLDEVLEEQRLRQVARQEAERLGLEEERRAAEEQGHVASEVIVERVEEIEEGLDETTSPEQRDVLDAPALIEKEHEEEDDNGRQNSDGEERLDESGADGAENRAENEEVRGDDEIDFIGDDEEDNVWQ